MRKDGTNVQHKYCCTLTWSISLAPSAHVLHDALHAELRMLAGKELARGGLVQAHTAHRTVLRELLRLAYEI